MRPFCDAERGAGLIGTIVGIGAFLLLLALAVQVLFGLYATSVVTAAAFDAAHVVAGAEGGRSEADARARAASLLGSYWRDNVRSFSVTDDGDVVRVRVVAVNPGFLPAEVPGLRALRQVDRTVTVRKERLR